MGFMEAVSTCFRKYATFGGRAPRSEYWWFTLFNIIVGFVLGLFEALAGSNNEILSSLYSLLVLLPSLAVGVRRLHDVNQSGWWLAAPYALVVITVASAAANLMIFAWAAGISAAVLVILILGWVARTGTSGENRFGPDPLATAA